MQRRTKVIIGALIVVGLIAASLWTFILPADRGDLPPPPVQTSPPPAPVQTSDPRGTKLEDYVEVEVYYGTDRKTSGSAQPALYYSGKRGTFEVGTCRVSIPKGHQVGHLESPAWWKLQLREDPSKHIVLLDVAPLPEAEMYAKLKASLAQTGEEAVLVFVHGYNVAFEEAARRTAQIAYDLSFDGVPAFYSWPSNGDLLDYTADEADVQWSIPHLKTFLEDLVVESNAKKVHLIAHSMGNRALTAALQSIAAEHDEPLFNQVILTAPDIDAEVFARDVVPAIRPSADRITLYASSKDRAIDISNDLHGYPRAGESGEHLVVMEGLDTIDASQVDTDLLGHTYFAQTRVLLSDLYLLLQYGQTPAERNLLERQKDTLTYWAIQ